MGDRSAHPTLAWYFPEVLVYATARRMDRRGRHGRSRRDGANVRNLRKISAGGELTWSDIADFLNVQGILWLVLLGLSILPSVIVIGVGAIVNGLGNFYWILGVTGSLPPALLSFGLIFYLHGIAMQQHAEDGDESTFLVRHFLVPRRVNIVVMPIAGIAGFVIVGLATNWYRN